MKNCLQSCWFKMVAFITIFAGLTWITVSKGFQLRNSSNSYETPISQSSKRIITICVACELKLFIRLKLSPGIMFHEMFNINANRTLQVSENLSKAYLGVGRRYIDFQRYSWRFIAAFSLFIIWTKNKAILCRLAGWWNST